MRMHTVFWVEDLKGRNYLEDLGVDGILTLELFLRKYGGNELTGFIWLRIGTSGGLLLTQ
jgi:hypothetical protein